MDVDIKSSHKVGKADAGYDGSCYKLSCQEKEIIKMRLRESVKQVFAKNQVKVKDNKKNENKGGISCHKMNNSNNSDDDKSNRFNLTGYYYNNQYILFPLHSFGIYFPRLSKNLNQFF